MCAECVEAHFLIEGQASIWETIEPVHSFERKVAQRFVFSNALIVCDGAIVTGQFEPLAELHGAIVDWLIAGYINTNKRLAMALVRLV